MGARRSAPTILSSGRRLAGLLALAWLAACAGAPPRGELARGDDAFHEGRYDQAGRLYARAAAATADPRALNGMAAIERLEGRYDQAADLYRRTAGVLEKAAGPDPLALRAVYFNLAQASSLAGRVPDAVAAYGKFLELANKEQAGGEELAGQLAAAGQFFSLQEYFTEAVKCYKRALAIRERVLPPGSAGIAELSEDVEASMKALRKSGSDAPPPGATPGAHR